MSPAEDHVDRILIAAPGFNVDDRDTRAALDRALRILDDLSDPSLVGPHPGNPTKSNTGACRLCGKLSKLTFEHIPPKSAGNDAPVRGVEWSAALVRDDPVAFPSSGWFQSQRGVGGNVLCEPCNNWLGTNLVPEYSLFSDAVLSTLASGSRVVDGTVFVPRAVELKLDQWAIGSIARQGLAMLLATSGSGSVTARFPELNRIIRGATRLLPPNLALGLSIVLGSRCRLTRPTARVGPGDSVTVALEAAHMPFAWTLTFEERGAVPEAVGLDVSRWLAQPIDKRIDATVELTVGTVQLAVPFAYRDEGTVRSEMLDRTCRPDS